MQPWRTYIKHPHPRAHVVVVGGFYHSVHSNLVNATSGSTAAVSPRAAADAVPTTASPLARESGTEHSRVRGWTRSCRGSRSSRQTSQRISWQCGLGLRSEAACVRVSGDVTQQHPQRRAAQQPPADALVWLGSARLYKAPEGASFATNHSARHTSLTCTVLRHRCLSHNSAILSSVAAYLCTITHAHGSGTLLRGRVHTWHRCPVRTLTQRRRTA